MGRALDHVAGRIWNKQGFSMRIIFTHVLPAFLAKAEKMQTTATLKDGPDGRLSINFAAYDVVVMNYSSLAL
jgi:hypothetical protein